MALGNSAIQNARTSLNAIKTALDSVDLNNKDFVKVFEDVNFQTFVKETNKGTALNEQLKSLSEWITSMYNTVDALSAATDSYLTTQENLNS
jgi:hypothetical protein